MSQISFGPRRGLPTAPRRLLRRHGWNVLVILAATGLTLSFIGFLQIVRATAEPEGSTIGEVLTALYQSLLGLWFNAGGMGVPWTVQLGRMLTLVSAAIMGGSLAVQLLRSEFRRGRARRMKRHVILCGLGELGGAAADALIAANSKLTVVDRAASFATDSLARRGAGIIIGDATDPFTLLEAGVDRAQHLLACCGDDDVNASVAEAARSVIEQKGRRVPGALSARVHIDDPDLLRQLRPCVLEIMTEGIDIDFFSVAEIAAGHIVGRAVGGELARGKEQADVVIVGDGALAEQLIVDIARTTPACGTGRLTPIVLLAGPHATELRDSVLARHPSIKRHLLLTVHSGDTEAESRPLELSLVPGGRPLFRLAFVCFDDDGQTVRTGLGITAATRHPPEGFRTILCIYGQSGIATVAERTHAAGLRVFDATDAVRSPGLVTLDTVDHLARLTHASYCADELEKPEGERTSKFAPWDDIGEEAQENNRDYVRNFLDRLTEAGLRLAPLLDEDEPAIELPPDTLEMLAASEHRRWCDFYTKRGWTFGPRSDSRKIHNCLAPWEELDESQRDKDRNPVRRMPTLLREAGIALVRRTTAVSQTHDRHVDGAP